MAERSKNIRLGLFVTIGTLLLIAALYFIGSRQNLFGSSFRISAVFYNVNGLMKGNNVRFAGIDVGTVESINIISDSSVKVVMIIDENVKGFIKKNDIASVGTDGLMGNKLININAGKGQASPVGEGDLLKTLKPIEMDEMVRTLNITNENMMQITSNLKNITDRINSKNSLWNLLMDTIVAENVKSSIVNLKLVTNKSVLITGNLHFLSEQIRTGQGSLGALITDTILSTKVNQTVVRLKAISDSAAIIEGNIAPIVNNLKQGKGSLGLLLNDTVLIHDLNRSIRSIDKGAVNFNENMEALKYSWPFKKYYRKQKAKK